MDKRMNEVAKAGKHIEIPARTGAPKQTPKATGSPEKFTYTLAAYTAERRRDGWYVAKTVPGFTNEKPKWSGPFETIENAALSIGRQCAVEIADRHTRSVEGYKIARTDGLYGLKPNTRIAAR